MPDERAVCNAEDEGFEHAAHSTMATRASFHGCTFCFAATKTSATMVLALYLAAKSF
jgi:hypothetical protein